MQLRRINIRGTWSVYAEVDADGGCPLEDHLAQLADDRKTTSYAAGLVQLLDRVNDPGPKKLGTQLFHCVDANNEIYEFIKGPFRLLCFQMEGRIVVCSHIFRKTSQRTPRKEIKRAVALRERYVAAKSSETLILID